MLRNKINFTKLTVIASLLAASAVYFIFMTNDLFSDSHGRTGVSMPNSQGCGGEGCHGGVQPNPSTITTIESGTSSFKVLPGSTTNFTITIDNPLGIVSGFDLSVVDIGGNNSGTLKNVLSDCKVVNGELVHSVPKLMDNGISTFQFTWTAPDSQGVYYFFCTSCACNNDSLANLVDTWSFMSPVEITVTWGDPMMTITPSTVDFGEVKLNHYKDSTIIVKNTGKNPLSVTGIEFFGLNKNEFSMPQGATLFDLLPDSTRNIKIRFSPNQMNGDKSATINFTNNSPQTPKILTLAGKCNTKSSAILAADPVSIDFGNVEVGKSKELALSVTNSGDLDLQINSANISGPAAKDFSFASPTTMNLAPDSTDSIIVHFEPTSTGKKFAQFNFSSNSETDVVIQMSGVATSGPQPGLAFDRDTVFFGNRAVGYSVDTLILVKNTGQNTLTVTEMKISGPYAVEYSITSGLPPFTLSEYDEHPIGIRYKPIISGLQKMAYIEFSSNDPKNPRLYLSGDAFDVPKPVIETSVSSLYFGEVETGKSIDSVITVYNKGNADLIIQNLNFSGKDSLSFSAPGNVLPRTVLSGSSVPFVLRFGPQTAGDKTANVKILSNDQNISLPLAGKAKPFNSVLDFPDSPQINIIPLPGHEQIRIVLSNRFDSIKNLLPEIYDVYGKKLDIPINISDGTLEYTAEIAFLPAGEYIIRFGGESCRFIKY